MKRIVLGGLAGGLGLAALIFFGTIVLDPSFDYDRLLQRMMIGAVVGGCGGTFAAWKNQKQGN